MYTKSLYKSSHEKSLHNRGQIVASRLSATNHYLQWNSDIILITKCKEES